MHDEMTAMHDGAMTMMGWGMMLIWALVGIALVALLVVGVIWLAARVRPERGSSERADATALSDLERRDARGDLDRETFLQMRTDLLDRR